MYVMFLKTELTKGDVRII